MQKEKVGCGQPFKWCGQPLRPVPQRAELDRVRVRPTRIIVAHVASGIIGTQTAET